MCNISQGATSGLPSSTQPGGTGNSTSYRSRAQHRNLKYLGGRGGFQPQNLASCTAPNTAGLEVAPQRKGAVQQLSPVLRARAHALAAPACARARDTAPAAASDPAPARARALAHACRDAYSSPRRGEASASELAPWPTLVGCFNLVPAVGYIQVSKKQKLSNSSGRASVLGNSLAIFGNFLQVLALLTEVEKIPYLFR